MKKPNSLDNQPGVDHLIPCFALDFAERLDVVPEIHFDSEIGHRFPRMLALGNLLLDLARHSNEAHPPAHATLERQIKYDVQGINNTLTYDEGWPCLGDLPQDVPPIRDTYKEITTRCMDQDIFKTAMSATASMENIVNPSNIDADAGQRRSVIYRRIVAPLAALLADFGRTARLSDSTTTSSTCSDEEISPSPKIPMKSQANVSATHTISE
ncbi:hypothetical protein C1H76_8550 [Elsinoe australis]|uniref:Uncharacterized protein n=1 Tax=Elsinoe australis TaxID=40998 RepID=A0A4U7AUQ3_9PEZI|nr:hypothetical protein C1H76_8550 [Elsinoe australis]